MQRVAGNQILEIRIRDGANGLSMVAARYILRNRTQDLLSELVGHTLSKIAELLAELGVSAGEMQQPIIMSSDREGKEILWGSTGGQESETTSTVRKRATIFVADLVSQCASLVASSKAAVYPKTLPGINEIKKDFLQVSVECELLVCACLDLHKELLYIQPDSDVACLGELGLDGSTEQVRKRFGDAGH